MTRNAAKSRRVLFLDFGASGARDSADPVIVTQAPVASSFCAGMCALARSVSDEHGDLLGNPDSRATAPPEPAVDLFY